MAAFGPAMRSDEPLAESGGFSFPVTGRAPGFMMPSGDARRAGSISA